MKKKTEILSFRVLGRTKFFLLASAIFLFGLMACDRSSVVGLDVQPTNSLLNIGYQDTTMLITKTVREDSLRTDGLLITSSIALIGKYIDPIFGEAAASLYTQVKLPTPIVSGAFGTNPICDSIVLSLIYSGEPYGDSSLSQPQQKISIYQLNDALGAATTYYSNINSNYFNTDLANYSFTPKIYDSVSAEGTRLSPRLRVKLPLTFGQIILNNQSTGNLSTNDAFQAFMKGFYITTENTVGLIAGQGSILSFKMNDSKMTVFYHDGTANYTKYDFSLGGVARYSSFKHDYTNASIDIQNQIGSTPPSNNTAVFVQAMGGLKTKITMPFLMNWVKSGRISINKAELVIKADPSSFTYQTDSFPAPKTLYLFGIADDLKTSYFLPDMVETPYYFNGAFDQANHAYILNITRYIQQVLDKKLNNNGLFLTVPHITAATSANRVVLGGADPTSPLKMKLNITYTKLH